MQRTIRFDISSLRDLWQRLQRWISPPAAVTSDQLTHTDAAIRWRAVRSLQSQPQLSLLPELLALLAEDDAMVREETVRTLTSWSSPAVATAARQRLDSAPSAQALAALLRLSTIASAPASHISIHDYLSHEQAEVRAAAVQALSTGGTPADQHSLISMSADPAPEVRRAVVSALVAWDNPASITPLQQLCHDPDILTRQLALHGLAKRQQAETPARFLSFRQAKPQTSSED